MFEGIEGERRIGLICCFTRLQGNQGRYATMIKRNVVNRNRLALARALDGRREEAV